MKIAVAIAVLMATPYVCACAQTQDAAQDPMAMLGQLLGGGGTATNPVIHHSQLKALLPAEFSGMKRTNSEAGKQAAMGMNISYAEASYSDDNASLDAKITDISAMASFMRMAQYAWANSEMERESDSGYERTTKIDGFPAKEEYDNSGKYGRVEVMVDGRFIVEVSGSDVDMEKIVGLVKAIDLKKLQSLQPQ